MKRFVVVILTFVILFLIRESTTKLGNFFALLGSKLTTSKNSSKDLIVFLISSLENLNESIISSVNNNKKYISEQARWTFFGSKT